jgi:hypothetical protein
VKRSGTVGKLPNKSPPPRRAGANSAEDLTMIIDWVVELEELSKASKNPWSGW